MLFGKFCPVLTIARICPVIEYNHAVLSVDLHHSAPKDRPGNGLSFERFPVPVRLVVKKSKFMRCLQDFYVTDYFS